MQVPGADMTFDRQAAIEHLAHPKSYDWATGLVNNAEAARLRAASHRTTGRKLQAVSSVWNNTPASFNASATGRITSAPAYSYWMKKAFWLTEQGWVLTRDTATTAVGGFKLKEADNATAAPDTFPNTAITVSNDGKRLYMCSAQGRLFAIDAATGLNISGSPYSLGGAYSQVGFTAAPFIDALASRDDGQAESLYAVNNAGTLFRFYVSADHTTTSPGSLYMAQAYALPATNAGGIVDRFRTSPIVIKGKAYVGYWRDDTTTATLDSGGILVYNTNCLTPTTTTTTGALVRDVGLPSPVLAPPALDFDSNFNATLGFVPVGMCTAMIDFTTGNVAQSVPLVVDSKTPIRGSLLNYAYSASGISTVLKNKDANCAATIYDDNTKDAAALMGAWRYSTGNTSAGYGYVKFTVSTADLLDSGQLKVITDARLKLTCSAQSNSLGIYGTTPMRVFKVSNTDTLGGTWSNTSLSSLIRPGFEDGNFFSLANLATHTNKELLPNTVNAYATNSPYTWPAAGQVGGVQSYTFGLAHTQLYYNPGLLGGVLSQPAPRFNPATPQLQLTLSSAGFINPSPINAISIDSANQQIFVANTNALYQVSYAGANFAAQASNFSLASSANFALTRVGQDLDSPGQAGPTANMGAGVTRFVENIAAPLFDGVNVYVHDNHPKFKKTSVNVFTPGAPGSAPTLSSYVVLVGSGTDAEEGASYMCYDYESDKLFVGTGESSTTSTAGRAWVFSRF